MRLVVILPEHLGKAPLPPTPSHLLQVTSISLKGSCSHVYALAFRAATKGQIPYLLALVAKEAFIHEFPSTVAN